MYYPSTKLKKYDLNHFQVVLNKEKNFISSKKDIINFSNFKKT